MVTHTQTVSTCGISMLAYKLSICVCVCASVCVCVCVKTYLSSDREKMLGSFTMATKKLTVFVCGIETYSY